MPEAEHPRGKIASGANCAHLFTPKNKFIGGTQVEVTRVPISFIVPHKKRVEFFFSPIDKVEHLFYNMSAYLFGIKEVEMKTNVYKSASSSFLGGRTLERGTAWGIMIIGALLAFEIFNFSSTAFALEDMLGDLRFLGIRWAIILAIAFCGIDFAGVARLFTPEKGADEPAEVWYLFGAWILAAMMNAMLTWWGVSMAIAQNGSIGSAVVSSETMTKVVPIFVAVMVWLIRVLIIGTFSIAGDRLFSQDTRKKSYAKKKTNTRNRYPKTPTSRRPAPKPQASFSAEPTYHNLSASGSRQNSRREHRF